MLGISSTSFRRDFFHPLTILVPFTGFLETKLKLGLPVVPQPFVFFNYVLLARGFGFPLPAVRVFSIFPMFRSVTISFGQYAPPQQG